MKRLLACLAVLATLSGCATSARRLAELKVGMTKGDVVRVMGKPDGSSAFGGQESWTYRLKDERAPLAMTKIDFLTPYLVEFRMGRVTGWGVNEQVAHAVDKQRAVFMRVWGNIGSNSEGERLRLEAEQNRTRSYNVHDNGMGTLTVKPNAF